MDLTRSKNQFSRKSPVLQQPAREFLAFMRGWRKAAEGMVSRYDAFYHFPGWFLENILGFCGFAETIRADFSGERRKKFESFTSTITDSNWRTKGDPDDYKKWLKIVDEMIMFVEFGHD